MYIFLALLVLISIFVLPIYFTIKSKKTLIFKGSIIGFIIGLGIMTYDFEGFVNPGGPSTPITNTLSDIVPLSIFPLPILGTLIGLIIGYLLQKTLATKK
jgi:hypothetical protein